MDDNNEIKQPLTILYNYALNACETFNYVNHNNFYLSAKASYRNYYTRVLMRVAQWFDGYVFGFHDQKNGIFSTRLAVSLVRGIGNQICGRKLLFKPISSPIEGALDKINDWQRESGFQDAVRKGIKLAVGLGTSLLKLNVASNGDLWCDAFRFDSFYFETDFRGRLIDVTCLIRSYSAANARDQKTFDFYLVEHRYIAFKPYRKPIKKPDGSWGEIKVEIGKPYVVYEVHKCVSDVTIDQSLSAQSSEKVRFDSLPSDVRNAIRRDYRVMKLDEPTLLPFKDSIGCELLKFDEDMALPGMPFGSSVLQDLIAYLMTYDLAWSYYVRDIFQGAGTVLLPSNFIKDNNGNQNNVALPANVLKVPSLNPDAQKPDKIQFELRGAEWEAIQNNILKKIATQIGMSPKTIAAYLENGTVQKTATEIDAEDDATIAYIEIKRGQFERPINRLLETALNYLAIPGDYTVVFGTPTLVNKDKIIDREVRKLESGLTSKEDSVRIIYDDEDEDQIQARLARIKVEEEKQTADSPQPMDEFGA